MRVGDDFRIGKMGLRQQISGMSTVAEIESALKKLPVQHAQEVANWLENYLKQQSATKSSAATAQPVKLPDYAERRRQIFGDKVLPNMVLLAREQERW